MSYINIEVEGEYLTEVETTDDPYVRLSNPIAENGEPQAPGPLTWLNSARLTIDSEDDAIHCVVSVADPRGGFAFTLRRTPNGRLLIHTHCDTTEVAPGTLQVVGDFSDEQEEEVQ